jgi:iron complex outermembrane receptor protein
VVLIESKRFKENRTQGQLRLMSGNYNYRRADADITFNMGKFGFGLRGGYKADDGYKINNDSTMYTGGVRLSYTFGPKKSLSFVLDEIFEESGLSGLPDFPTPYSRQKSKNLSSSITFEYQNFINNLYYNRGEVKNNDPTRDLNNSLVVAEFGESLTYEKTLSFGKLTLGAGYTQTDADSTDFGKKSENTIHVFGDLNFKIGSLPFTFNTGLRYNINSEFQNSMNPEFGITYTKGPFEASYKLSYGVNTPSFQQRYTHTSSTDPNPDLGVEKALNHNLNLSLEVHKTLTLNTTFFMKTLDGRITYVRDLNIGIGSYQNLGKTIYKGFDFGMDWKPSPKFEFKGNYTYLIARDMDIHRFLTSTPRYSTTMEVIIKPIEDLTLAIKGDYDGKTFLDRNNQRHLGGRTLYFLRMEYSLSPVVIFLNMDNVLDKEYYYIDGLLAPPLKYYVGIKYNF